MESIGFPAPQEVVPGQVSQLKSERSFNDSFFVRGLLPNAINDTPFNHFCDLGGIKTISYSRCQGCC